MKKIFQKMCIYWELTKPNISFLVLYSLYLKFNAGSMDEAGFNEHQKFISQISVKLPYINQLNYNACIKIDDNDYNYSNPGVWVHTVHYLKKRDVFTDWTEYKKDEKIC